MIFQLLIKTKMLKNKDLSDFTTLNIVFILLINVKMPMPTFVDILTFMSTINCSCKVEHEKFYNPGPSYH